MSLGFYNRLQMIMILQNPYGMPDFGCSWIVVQAFWNLTRLILPYLHLCFCYVCFPKCFSYMFFFVYFSSLHSVPSPFVRLLRRGQEASEVGSRSLLRRHEGKSGQRSREDCTVPQSLSSGENTYNLLFNVKIYWHV